ncbi:MAG: hypothetical protein GC179_16590 [Anaerolineaceae bacterium]|nr:hypothetical protein [Anaerolineaceae bacterium]
MTTIQAPPKSMITPQLKRWLLILTVAITPSLVSYFLITSQGYQVTDFMPRWNDEVSYWNQINTFREVGLNGGYFTINELEPPAQFTHFYTYGPWFPAIYGTIARIIGWNSTTILVINTMLIGLALVIFCIAAQLNSRQLVLTILLLASMWGLLLYLFTGMQEAYQQVIAILLASLFAIALREREKTRLRYKVIGLLLIVFAAVMRLSWAILFLPFFVLTGKKTVLRWIGYIIAAIAATLLVIVIANYTGAPGNNSVFDMVSAFQVSIGAGLDYFTRYLAHNLGRLLFLPKPGTDVLQTYQIIVLIVGIAAFALQLFIHRKKTSNPTSEVLFHLYNLGVTVIAACSLYLIGTGGDYRLLACHFMITLLIMIAYKRYRLVLMIIFTNLVFVTVFLGDFRDYTLSKFSADHSTYTTFKQAAETYLPYDPKAPNAWCNTLLIAVQDYDGTTLVGTPAGIGISFFKNPENPILKFKSHYLFLSTENYNLISQRPDAPKLTPLTSLLDRILYLNQSADCPTSTS